MPLGQETKEIQTKKSEIKKEKEKDSQSRKSYRVDIQVLTKLTNVKVKKSK